MRDLHPAVGIGLLDLLGHPGGAVAAVLDLDLAGVPPKTRILLRCTVPSVVVRTVALNPFTGGWLAHDGGLRRRGRVGAGAGSANAGSLRERSVPRHR